MNVYVSILLEDGSSPLNSMVVTRQDDGGVSIDFYHRRHDFEMASFALHLGPDHTEHLRDELTKAICIVPDQTGEPQ